MSTDVQPLEQLVIFSLAEEAYGVDIARVSGIERMQAITKVPRTNAAVKGVINLRGKVIPVVDLRIVFNLTDTEETKETRIVVMDIEGQPIGCLVDAVTEVLRIPADSVEPPSSVITNADSKYLLGIAKLDDRMIILLDLDEALSRDQKKALNKMTETSAEEVDVASAEFEDAVAKELEVAGKKSRKKK